MWTFGQFWRCNRREDRIVGRVGAIGRQPQGQHGLVDLGLQTNEVEVEHLGQITIGFTRLTRLAILRFAQHADDANASGRRGGRLNRERYETTGHRDDISGVEQKGCHHVETGDSVLAPVEDQHLFIGEVGPRRADPTPRCGRRIGEIDRVDIDCGDARAIAHSFVEVTTFRQPVELPGRQVGHEHDQSEASDVERDPPRPKEEAEHVFHHRWNATMWDTREMSGSELPDFRIPHAEKIEWMIETSGWAIEPVAAVVDGEHPFPGYVYTIGFPQRFVFPEVVIFGLTPVASKGILDLVAQQLEGGGEVPLDVPVVGLLDNELRCVFATIPEADHGGLFATGRAWHRGDFAAVQLMWPDRQGWLPYEDAFDLRLRTVQPVIGRTPD